MPRKPKRDYKWDHVPVDPNRDRAQPIYEGLGVGTIRSNLSEVKLAEGEWCVMFGHRFRIMGGEDVCTNCWRGRAEIESGV